MANISAHLIELFETLKYFNFKEVETTQGFDPKGLFYQHLTLMTYDNLFTKIIEGSGDNDVKASKEK